MCNIFKTFPIINRYFYVITSFITFTYLVERRRWQPWGKSIVSWNFEFRTSAISFKFRLFVLSFIFILVAWNLSEMWLRKGRYFSPKSSYKIGRSCICIVVHKKNERGFIFLWARTLEPFVVSSLSFVVSQKSMWSYTPSSSFEIVCSCVLIVGGSLKTNVEIFDSEIELQYCL